MKHYNFRDFLYNWNDYIVALIILILASGIIVWRLSIIMDYPETLSKETRTQITTHENTDANLESKTPSADMFSGGKLIDDTEIVIKEGTPTQSAKSLIDAKIFDDIKDFENSCKLAKVDPADIEPGKYTLLKGLSKEDIAKTVTAFEK